MSNEYASAGYIVELYQDLEALNGYLAHYKNTIIEIQVKYSKENNIDLKKLSEEEKGRLLTIIPALRNLVIRINIKMLALKKRITTFTELENAAFIEKYNLVVNSPSPAFEDIYEVTKKFNEVFVDGVIDSLLIQAQSIYQGGLSNA